MQQTVSNVDLGQLLASLSPEELSAALRAAGAKTVQAAASAAIRAEAEEARAAWDAKISHALSFSAIATAMAERAGEVAGFFRFSAISGGYKLEGKLHSGEPFALAKEGDGEWKPVVGRIPSSASASGTRVRRNYDDDLPEGVRAALAAARTTDEKMRIRDAHYMETGDMPRLDARVKGLEKAERAGTLSTSDSERLAAIRTRIAALRSTAK